MNRKEYYERRESEIYAAALYLKGTNDESYIYGYQSPDGLHCTFPRIPCRTRSDQDRIVDGMEGSFDVMYRSQIAYVIGELNN